MILYDTPAPASKTLLNNEQSILSHVKLFNRLGIALAPRVRAEL